MTQKLQRLHFHVASHVQCQVRSLDMGIWRQWSGPYGPPHPESGPFAYEHRIYTRRPWTTRLKITTFPRIYQYNGRLCFRWSEHRGSVAMDVREIKSIMCSPARRKKSINNKWLFRKGSFIDGCSCRGLVAGCYVNIISVKYPSTSFSLRIYLRYVVVLANKNTSW